MSDWAGWGSVSVEPNLAVYPVGRIVTLTAQPNDGIVFNKWRIYDPNHAGDANYTVTDANNPLTLVMMGDRDVVAVFRCAGATGPLLPIMLGVLGSFVWMRRSSTGRAARPDRLSDRAGLGIASGDPTY